MHFQSSKHFLEFLKQAEKLLNVAELDVHGIYTQRDATGDDKWDHGTHSSEVHSDGRWSGGDFSPVTRRSRSARAPSCSGRHGGSGGGVLFDGRWLERAGGELWCRELIGAR